MLKYREVSSDWYIYKWSVFSEAFLVLQKLSFLLCSSIQQVSCWWPEQLKQGVNIFNMFFLLFFKDSDCCANDRLAAQFYLVPWPCRWTDGFTHIHGSYGIDIPLFILGFLQQIVQCKVTVKVILWCLASVLGSSSVFRNPNRTSVLTCQALKLSRSLETDCVWICGRLECNLG